MPESPIRTGTKSNSPGQNQGDSLVRNELPQQILDSLTAEIAVLDKTGTIVAVNRAWTRFAEENGGSQVATGIGTNYLDVCRRADGEDSLAGQLVSEGIQQVMDGSKPVFKFEYPCHSDTQQRWFLLHVSRLDTAGPYVVTTHLPITDRKMTEQRLVVAERLAAVGEAMQGLGHEGRNALQRAQAHIELLRTHLQDNSEAIDLIERIERAQYKLLDLYEEVKDYAGPIILHCQPCQLDKLAVRVWVEFESTSSQAIFLLSSQVSELTCDVDTNAISRVIRELFSNALAAGRDKPEIEVHFLDDVLDGLSAVTVVVSDNASGIPESDWEKVFEPFYTTRTHGTGLGLAVSRRIVSAHHGRIRVGKPRLGGTSVYVTLPVNHAA